MANQRSLLAIIILSHVFLISYSQPISPVSKLYANLSGVIKPQRVQMGGGGELGLTLVIRNKLSISLSNHNMDINPSNLPGDFEPGHSEGMALFFPYSGPDLNPSINCKIYSLTMGRYFSLGKRSWFQLEGGPSFISGEKAKFKKQAVTSGYYNYLLGYESYTRSNYTMTRERKQGLGALMRADIQHAVSRNLALGFTLATEISSVQSPLFMEVRMLTGYFGLPKKSKKINHKTPKP